MNKGNLAFEYDQVHIICPVYEPGTFDNETEKLIIYNVSKAEYETCRITNANPRIIAVCDKPQKLMYFTITFRPFTPSPGGLEFLPGHDYYFICECALFVFLLDPPGVCTWGVYRAVCSPDLHIFDSCIWNNNTAPFSSENNDCSCIVSNTSGFLVQFLNIKSIFPVVLVAGAYH